MQIRDVWLKSKGTADRPIASKTDILRVCAVLGCIWQALIVLLSKKATGVDFRTGIMLETFVKYTAATFIFANVFDLAKLRDIKYKNQIGKKARALLIPYFLWAIVYMLILNTSSYHNIWDVFQALIFGTAAPNLWYTVMMFQFELLVIPIIMTSKKIQENKNLIIPLLIGAFIAYFIFLYIYDRYSFKSTNPYISYMDRTFIMYSIYAVLGIVASTYEKYWDKFINKVKYLAIPTLIVVYGISINGGLSQSLVSFSNISYLTPIMFAYNVLIIIVLYALAMAITKHVPKMLPNLKWLNIYAFRTYLSYIVYLYFVVDIVLGKCLTSIPFGLRLILVYIMTVTLTFTSSYVLHVIKVVLYDRLLFKRDVII